MKTVWLGTLKGEERENLKNYLTGNKKVLDILQEMLYNMYREVEKQSFDYDSPSWAYKQAHINGQKEILLKVIDICKITD